MVVFFSCIFIILLIIILLMTAKIKMQLINFKIKDFKSLETILVAIKDKEYVKIFDYIDFTLKLQIYIFNKIKIFGLNVTDEQIEKFLRKQIRKNKLKKEERELVKFEEDDSKQIKKDIKKIKLENLDLNLKLGVNNAGTTAIVVTIINILISNLLPIIIDEQNYKNLEKYRYNINPIYVDGLVFQIKISLIISIPAKDLINLIK